MPEIIVENEQCNSRIAHLPHYWRVDGKTVVPADLGTGHRHMRQCAGRIKPEKTVHPMLKAVLRSRAEEGAYRDASLYLRQEDVDELQELFKPSEEEIRNNTLHMHRVAYQLTGMDIITVTDDELARGKFQVRARPYTEVGPPPHILVEGPVFSDAS